MDFEPAANWVTATLRNIDYSKIVRFEKMVRLMFAYAQIDNCNDHQRKIMRYLFLFVIFCMPTWVTANLLDADTRYSCQTDTTFGWKDDASFSRTCQ